MESRAPAFGVEQTWTDRVVVVAAHGDIDALTAPRLAEAIDSAVTDQPTAVIVDLSDVDFLASSGMTVLLSAHQQVTPNARFGVVADGPGTSRPLKLMAIDAVLALHPTLADALAACAEA